MRKKIVRTLLSALLVCTLLITPALAENATVTADDVNMRAGPGTMYRIVDVLPLGATVIVTDRSSAWYAVQYNGQSGYITAQYLNVQEEASAGTDGQAFINADGVRFRSAPNSGAPILDEYSAGKAVTITGSTVDGWVACTIDGQDGYIYSEFITIGDAAAVTTSRTGSNASVSVSFEDGPVVIVPSGQNVSPAYSTPQAESPSYTEEPEIVVTGSQSTIASRGGSTAQSNISSVTETNVSVVPSSPASVSPSATTTTRNEGQAGYISGDYVRFRSGPSSTNSILGTYNYGKALTITGVSGDWTACIIDGQAGYVYSDYVARSSTTTTTNTGEDSNDVVLPENYQSNVQRTRGASLSTNVVINPAKVPHYWPGATVTTTATDPTIAYINANGVRFRSAPSMSSDILDELSFGNTVTITGTAGEWTAITYKGQAGYVYASYVTAGQYQNTSVGGTVKGREIADYALQYVGYNYVWGGTSPSTGFDCSGFVYYVYQHFGYTLNRVAADQARNGVHVDPSNLQPGDILCFYSGNDYIGHVGIYIGNNRFVHAQNSATGVVTTELAGYYANRGYEARRII